MTLKANFLKNSIIIGAHPDDELLWFASIIDKVDQVLLVFENFWPDPDIGPARATALANYPRKHVSSLRLEEAATYGCADWGNPKLTSTGISLGYKSHLRDVKKNLKNMLGKTKGPELGIQASYEANYDRLLDELRKILKADMNVFSHNPWGEYGHEDHIQVFRALNQLREEIGFKFWITNYCTQRSLPLAMTYFQRSAPNAIELPVNKEFAEKVARVYRDAGCWTWADDWAWFDNEHFMEAPYKQVNEPQQGHLFPLNMFSI